MSTVIRIPVRDIVPDESEIISLQGIPQDAEIGQSVYDLISDSLSILEEEAEPVAIISEISSDIFREIFFPPGYISDSNAIIRKIFQEGEKLAVYVVTLGHRISITINKLFSESDFALGSILDAAASAATDRGTKFGELYFSSQTDENLSTLLYSPGYCGWDISAQSELFEYIKPGQIGVTINRSFLMTPLKSVSGVLVSGNKDIHIFENNFSYCNDCKTFSCRDRIELLK